MKWYQFGLIGVGIVVAPSAHATVTLKGWVDGITAAANGSQTIFGWACVVGSASPVSVDLYLGGAYGQGGKFIGRYRADQPSEPDVGQRCSSGGTTHRFAIGLSAAVVAQNPGYAVFVHALSPALDQNQVLPRSGKYPLVLTADGTQLVTIGSPGGGGWATDTNYYTRWGCTSGIGLRNIRRLQIMPLGNHVTGQWKDSLAAGLDGGPNSAGNPTLYFTQGDESTDSLGNWSYVSKFKMLRAKYDSAQGAWIITQYLADRSNEGGVSSHDGDQTDYVYNRYHHPGWGPYASRPSSVGTIPGVNAQLALWGTGPLGLTAVQSLVNDPAVDANTNTCLHENPSLYDYDAQGRPHSFIVSLFTGATAAELSVNPNLEKPCKLPPGAPIAALSKPGPYVYHYVNDTVGWQLDLNTGLVEDLNGLDYAINADRLQPGAFTRSDWSGKVLQVKLTPRATTTLLDCSASGMVHFSEPSRGPNGSYYVLVDETPFHGLDGSGTGYTNLDPQVYQHDIFVAF